MRISIVIPTYRARKIKGTLRSLMSADRAGLDVQIIVVDDGSPDPVAPVIQGYFSGSGPDIRFIRQDNSGPAAARNTGFRSADGELVVFVDDDIVVPTSFLKDHAGAHTKRPGSVICGSWVLPQNSRRHSFGEFMARVAAGWAADDGSEFTPIEMVSSGHISVVKAMFESKRGVYRNDLRTPGAEEHELSIWLKKRGIPILRANRIVALHDHDVTLSNMCRQQYKHAVGCGEAVAKVPDALDLPEIKRAIELNTAPSSEAGQTVRRMLRNLSATPSGRGLLCLLAGGADALGLPLRWAGPLYRAALGAHFIAGTRDGLRLFKSDTARGA